MCWNIFFSSSPSPLLPSCSDAYGLDDDCDRFDLINTGVFYNISSIQDLLLAYTMLRSTFSDGKSFIRAAYNASFASASSYLYPNTDPLMSTPEWRENAYRFCTIVLKGVTLTCNLLTVRSFGFDEFDQSISEYYYTLLNGACANSISLTEEAWERAGVNPPTRLIEYYYECRKDTRSAVVDALGIAVGNTSLIVPILGAIIIPLLYLYYTLTNTVPPKDDYTKEEVEAMGKFVAWTILRFRDGRTLGLKRDGYIDNFHKELMNSLKGEAGVQDSDDESDSDDDKPTNTHDEERGRQKMKKKKTTTTMKKRVDQGNTSPGQGKRETLEMGRDSTIEPVGSGIRSKLVRQLSSNVANRKGDDTTRRQQTNTNSNRHEEKQEQEPSGSMGEKGEAEKETKSPFLFFW
jgi:hypothetical protein